MARRITQEFEDLESHPDEKDRFFVDRQYVSSNVWHWDCTMVIEELQTAYRHTFLKIRCEIPPEYPFRPPKILFKTPVFHPYLHRGELCEHILRRNWSHTKKMRDVLSSIYEILVSDGSNLDHLEICRESSMEETRNLDYVFFDQIIQRCLRMSLPEETPLSEEDNATWDMIGEWQTQVRKQRQLNANFIHLVNTVFEGKFQGLQTTVLRILGIVEGLFINKDEFTRLVTFPAVKAPEETIVVTPIDGKALDFPKWNNLSLFSSMNPGSLADGDNSLFVPLSSENLSNVLSFFTTQEELSVRIYNPGSESVSELIKPIKSLDMKSVMALLKTADFLGAHRLVFACCVQLSHYIRRNGRRLYVKHTESRN